MNKPEQQYRIVKIYCGFFSHWYYELQVYKKWRFFWTWYESWKRVAGNALEETVPDEWRELNIIYEITLPIGEKPDYDSKDTMYYTGYCERCGSRKVKPPAPPQQLKNNEYL